MMLVYLLALLGGACGGRGEKAHDVDCIPSKTPSSSSSTTPNPLSISESSTTNTEGERWAGMLNGRGVQPHCDPSVLYKGSFTIDLRGNDGVVTGNLHSTTVCGGVNYEMDTPINGYSVHRTGDLFTFPGPSFLCAGSFSDATNTYTVELNRQ